MAVSECLGMHDLPINAYEVCVKMVVTRLSISLALRRICELTCGTAPKVIQVKVQGDAQPRVFSAFIPWEYRREVYLYLAQHLAIPTNHDVVLLDESQAAALLQLVLLTRERHSARGY